MATSDEASFRSENSHKIAMTDIAIIMVSHNKIVDGCLASVRRAREASELSTHFVLVDNASTAFDAHELAKLEMQDAVVIRRDENAGFGHSCNRGAQEMESDYLFFLNPDTILTDEKVLASLHARMKKQPQLGIIAPQVLHFSGEHQETCRRFPRWYMPVVQRTRFGNSTFGQRYADAFLMRDVDHRRPRLIDWAQGSALFISRTLFEELGGFDKRFWMYFEDIDLCRRAWNLGRPVCYDPRVQLQHAHGKASAGNGVGHIQNLLSNRAARAHLVSWLKYQWKWRGDHVV